MRFQTPVTTILNNKTKITCLRFLYKYPANMTGRELAKMVYGSPSTIHRAMKELSDEQIVTFQSIGKGHIYQINKENLIVKKILIPMFDQEENLLTDFLGELVKNIQASPLKSKIISVALFGSVHEKKEKPDSDIDLFVLVKEPQDRKKVEDLIFEIDSKTRLQVNMGIEPYVKSMGEFKTDKDLEVIKSILKSHRVIFGKKLEDLL